MTRRSTSPRRHQSVGTATTNSSGVATLTGVTTTDAAGTHTDDVVASFAGDTNYLAAANASGDLVVSQAATTLASVSGTATLRRHSHVDGDAHLPVTSAGIANETVDFTLGRHRRWPCHHEQQRRRHALPT